MRHKTRNLYTSLYCAQFLFLGVQLPFLPGWLDAKGLSVSTIGWLTGVALLFRLLLGPLIVYQGEKLQEQRLLLWVMTAAMAGGVAGMMLLPSLWGIAIAGTVMIWAFGCIVPLTDAAVLHADKAGLINYGRARGTGSFAFVVATVIGGMVITRFGDNAAIWWLLISAVALFGISLILPAVPRDEHATKKLSFKDASKLFRSPSFLLMLITVGLTQGSHATYYTFSELHWSHLGFSPTMIGVLWATGVVAEIVILFQGRWMTKRFGAVGLMLIGAVAATIRWPLTGLSPGLPVLIALQCLHAATFACTYLGSVAFLAKAVPSSLTATSMTIVASLGIGAMTGLGAVVVGQIFTREEPFISYGLMGVMAALAIVSALALAQRWDGGLIRTVG